MVVVCEGCKGEQEAEGGDDGSIVVVCEGCKGVEGEEVGEVVSSIAATNAEKIQEAYMSA